MIPDTETNLTRQSRAKAELNMQISYLAPTQLSCYHFKPALTSHKHSASTRYRRPNRKKTFEFNPFATEKKKVLSVYCGEVNLGLNCNSVHTKTAEIAEMMRN